MLDYLPEETRSQVVKNILYINNVEKVKPYQKSLLFDIIMKTGKLPHITPTGYILNDISQLESTNKKYNRNFI